MQLKMSNAKKRRSTAVSNQIAPFVNTLRANLTLTKDNGSQVTKKKSSSNLFYNS